LSPTPATQQLSDDQPISELLIGCRCFKSEPNHYGETAHSFIVCAGEEMEDVVKMMTEECLYATHLRIENCPSRELEELPFMNVQGLKL